jgi:hypothetical protein
MCIRAKAIYIEAAGFLLLFVLLIGFVLAPAPFAAPFLVVSAVFGFWLAGMKCPRCKYPLFKGNIVGHFVVWLPISPRECRRCSLSFVAEDPLLEGTQQGPLGSPNEVRSQGELAMGDKPEYPLRVDFYRDGELLERDTYQAEWELLTDLESFDSEDHVLGEEARVLDRHERPVRLKLKARTMLTFELAAMVPIEPKWSP